MVTSFLANQGIYDWSLLAELITMIQITTVTLYSIILQVQRPMEISRAASYGGTENSVNKY
jgi:hypothetical protein